MTIKSILLVTLVGLTLSACSSPIKPTAGQSNDSAPVISLFAADSNKLTLLQTTNLHWEVLDQTAEIRIDPYPGNVPAIGTTSVVPTVVGTLSFVLTARNSVGTTQRLVTITVQ